jgi:hypothetical protein
MMVEQRQKPRPGRLLRQIIWTVALLLPVTLSPCHLVTLSRSHAEEETSKMPVIHRQFLRPERLAQEMKRVEEGVLIRLPVAEFDERVARAARGVERKVPPRLLEARYHAELREEALVGDAQWKVLHTGSAPGLLSLESFNLALRQARFENGDALIAAFDNKTPALLVETAGEQTVSLEWSSRAEIEPEGMRFHLELPPCPVALLELDVPAGREPVVLDDVLLSGPHPAEKAELRRWKIVCGGQRALDFRIRSADRPIAGGEPPALFVQQKTTQRLNPEGLDATFELRVESLTRGVRELVCECDPELRLRDVAGPGVDGCTLQPGAGDAPSRLIIRLREPVRKGVWQVFCLAPLSRAPLPANASSRITWRSPGLRLAGGVTRGETLELFIHPDLRVETWDAGGFRLTASDDAERQSGMRHLTLIGGGLVSRSLPARTSPRRPEARLQAFGVEYRAHQLAWWRCDGGGMALTLQIGYEVSQGQLFQLPVQLPDGWTVERVEMSPSGLLRNSRVRSAAGKTTLNVDLTRPLISAEEARREEKIRPRPLVAPERTGEPTAHPVAAGRSRVTTLTVHLRPVGSALPVGRMELPVPNAVPLGARSPEGAIALDCDEQLFHFEVRTAAERSEAEKEGPWNQPPEYYYRYRGQAVTGTLVVQPRPPRLRARCGSDVLVASGRAVVETHLLLEAEVGNPQTIDLLLSASDGGPWTWRTESVPRGEGTGSNAVQRAERLHALEATGALHVLAARDPLQAAVLSAALPAGERWRLRLARPLRTHEPLHLRATRQLQPHGNRWRVPLPVILNAGRMEGEVTLHLAGADLVRVETVGLREAVSPPRAGAVPWRTFRYGQTEVGLTLSGQTLVDDRSPRVVIDRARLITYVGAGDVLHHHFFFQVSNWKEHALPLHLPAGSRPLAVRVDGHWLPRLVAVEPPAGGNGEGAPEAEELVLPVPGTGDSAGDTPHRFEIVYTRPASSGLLWRAVEAPAPVLPVPPLAFRRSWRLSPGLVPLRHENYLPVPGTIGDLEPAMLPHHTSDLFHLPGEWSRLDPTTDDVQTEARAALAQAVEALRTSHAGEVMPLREVVREIAFHHLKDRYPLIVDALALRRARIDPDRPLTIPPLSAADPAPPWVECGLGAVPIGSAVVLTTTSVGGTRLHEPFSDPLEQAVAAAVARGQDSSGRFVSALRWLRPEITALGTAGRPGLLKNGLETAAWSEWEGVAGLAEDGMLVVRSDRIAGLGLAVTLLVVLSFWTIRRRSTHLRLALLILALAVCGLGTLWLPAALRDLAWWPLLTCGVGAVGWYLKAMARSREPSRVSGRAPRSTAATAAATGMLLLALLGWSGHTAAPEPDKVYLVPGPTDAPENQTVLIPADLLDRLAALARPGPLAPGGPQAVLLDAVYDGKLVENQAEFTAVFAAQCLGDEPVSLAVPLGGVQFVGDVLVDGARVDPLALPAPQAGLSIRVRGRGRHKVELRFRAAVAGSEEDRNVLFTLPPLVKSRLTWHIPPGATFTQALVKRGAERTLRDDKGERLEVDLGRLQTPVQPQASLHLHWYQPSQPARPVRVQFRSAYLWDLNLEGSLLTAWLRYRIADGAVRTLLVDLPPDLEVRSADGRRTAPASAAPSWLPLFHLRDWQVRTAGGKRTLHLELPFPVSGDLQVTLELVPRAPLPALVTLPLPAPRGERAPGLHYLAYRPHLGLDVQRGNSQNLTRISEDEFAPQWPDVPRLKAQEAAVAFKFGPERTPILPLSLSRRPPVVQADLDIVVQAGPQQAEIQATADLKAPNRDLGVVECDLQTPRWTVTSVTGEDVRSWKQTGQHLLIWLHRTTVATRLSLSGWLPLEHRAGPAQLDVPCLRIVPAGEQHTRLRLVATAGLTLASVKPSNLQPIPPTPPAQRPAENEQTFETRQAFYGLHCEVQAAANAVARVLTFAEVADRKLQFTSTVEYQVQHGELRRVQLRLRNWEAETVELQADRVALRQPLRRTLGDRSWRLDLQPGVTGRYRVILQGSMPIEEAAVGVLLPDVSVQGAERTEYFVALAGNELTGEARGNLENLREPVRALASWPGIAQRLEPTRGQGWRVRGPEWQLLLLPHARTLQAAPVRLFLLEQSAAVVDGQHWLHEARCWLAHEAHTDLTVRFAAPVRVVAAAVDGVEVPPLQPGASHLWLPLPGGAGVRCVRLRWMYRDAEPLDRPNLAAPEVADARRDAVLWTVLVPPGWEAAQSSPANRLGDGSAREGALALYRAEAQLRISQELSKQGREATAPLAAAQQRFAAYCRHARHALDMGANRGGVTGPAGQTLADWLNKLQADNRELAQHNGRDALWADAERQAAAGGTIEPDLAADDESVARFTDPSGKAGPLSQRGTPISWGAGPNTPPPTLKLTSRQTQRTRYALAASGQWLGMLTVLWVLSFLPYLLSRLRLFWPEQVALLAVVGWHLAGLTLVVLGLLIVAVGGRLIWLTRRLRRLFRRRRDPKPSTMTPASNAGS